MDWLLQNWVWLLIGTAFVALHLFGHGHGGHRRHGTRCARSTGRVPTEERRDKRSPATHGE
jgi:hypothetical protein